MSPVNCIDQDWFCFYYDNLWLLMKEFRPHTLTTLTEMFTFIFITLVHIFHLFFFLQFFFLFLLFCRFLKICLFCIDWVEVVFFLILLAILYWFGSYISISFISMVALEISTNSNKSVINIFTSLNPTRIIQSINSIHYGLQNYICSCL